MGIFKKQMSEAEKLQKKMEQETEERLKAINESSIRLGSFPTVYLDVEGEQVSVRISVNDYRKGRDKQYREKVDKVYSTEDAIRHDFLIYQTSKEDCPVQYKAELKSFEKLYGTPYDQFLKEYKTDKKKFGFEQAYAKQIIEKILKEYCVSGNDGFLHNEKEQPTYLTK